MTTPHPTRREADAWWESLPGFVRRKTRWLNDPTYRHARPGGESSDAADDAWWRSLPDERAIAIYREETKR